MGVLSKNKNRYTNVRRQIEVFHNGDSIQKKQAAIAQTIAPEKKAISLQQEKILPMTFDQTNDDVTTIANSRINKVQNKLNSVNKGKDHWVHPHHKDLFQQQQQQYAGFGRCQKQIWKKNPQAVQTTTKNRPSKKNGDTRIEKNQIHETEKNVIRSDKKVITKELSFQIAYKNHSLMKTSV